MEDLILVINPLDFESWIKSKSNVIKMQKHSKEPTSSNIEASFSFIISLPKSIVIKKVLPNSFLS